MKFTLNWLKDFLETDASLEQVSETLTAIGLEVEGITNPAETLAPFTVAEVIEATPHPDADKLRVCQVNTGNETLNIVCGAPNARAGIKVILARIGTVIPTNGMEIKKAKIRGVESSGMLCSARELGLGEDHDGIVELPANAPIGAPMVEVLGLNDPVIEIAITPNRGDCLGVYGIARDLAAAGLGTLKKLPESMVKAQGASPISVSLNAGENCPHYIGRAFSGVKNAPSPDWLQQRLKAIGLRPISALVDITNYFTFTYGRPLHVYDIKKLQGNIQVREGKQGEQFRALNDKDYTLKGGETVIADDKNVLGFAGIVGGEESGCELDTTEVFLEVGLFNAADVANTGRAHALDTDARYRFERHVDPAFLQIGAELASQMIIDLCGGTASELVIAGAAPEQNRTVSFKPTLVKKLGGVVLEEKQIQAILASLGFAVKTGGDVWQVTRPTWRPDIEQPADLVEEVLRIHGYDNLPSNPMPKLAQVSPPVVNTLQKRTATIRRQMAARGLNETYSWAFTSEADARLFGWENPGLQLQNPISSDLSIMRPSLLPHLVRAVASNTARGQHEIHLFEIGGQFDDVTPSGQKLACTGVRSGSLSGKHWQTKEADADFYTIKADVFAAFDAIGFDAEKCQIVREAPAWYHPGRSAALKLGPKNTLAYLGELHPAVLKALDVDAKVLAFELFIEAIPEPKGKGTARQPLSASQYQAVERDFAFVVDTNLAAEELTRVIAAADKKLIRHVALFDVYQGKGVEDGKKSLAYAVTLQADDRTLTDEEIEKVSKAVIEGAKTKGAALR